MSLTHACAPTGVFVCVLGTRVVIMEARETVLP